jgi:two-component system, OmpR family, phosphate regulon response regulator PhoB
MGAKILIVEDEEPLALLLRYNLEADGYEVETIARGDDADTRLREAAPDLVVLDWMLPGLSGIELCRRLRSRPESKALPIIMLTARGDETDRVVGLELGADDYVVKPFSARELVARIRAVLRRVPDETAMALSGATAGSEYRVGDLVVDTAMRRSVLNGEELSLTRREFDLLALLVSNAGTVITRERLIDEVWDTNWYGSTKTLDVHVSSLRRKLGDDAVDSHYLHTVRGVGFRFAGLDSPAG